MKTLILGIAVALMMLSIVSATDGELSEEYVTMSYNQTYSVEYCLTNNGNPVTNFPVVIDVVWQELDSILGYSAGDVMDPTGFDATLMANMTDANGCVDVQLDTYGESGLYGYSVNGYNGQSYVGNEIGHVYVPEFGIVAALGVLAIAGIFIARRRN